MPFVKDACCGAMMGGADGGFVAGLTLADGLAWAEVSGCCAVGLGAGERLLVANDAGLLAADVPAGRARYALACGNQVGAPDVAAVAASLAAMMHAARVEFAALCLAAPGWDRTVYQGHLFAGASRVVGLVEALRGDAFGRVAVVGQDVVASGAGAIAQRLGTLRAADVGLAVVDAIDETGCAAVAAAFAGQIVVAGPAWLAEAGPDVPAAVAAGPVAVLAGACDRQTLFQLGAARGRTRYLQLNFAGGQPVDDAVAWAGAPLRSCIIAASAPPDRRTPQVDAAAALAAVARGLAAAGWRRFVVAGNDSASAILAALGVRALTRGAPAQGLRWWHGGGYSFLLKPGGFGGRDLFTDLIEPQIGLNSAAE